MKIGDKVRIVSCPVKSFINEVGTIVGTKNDSTFVYVVEFNLNETRFCFIRNELEVI